MQSQSSNIKDGFCLYLLCLEWVADAGLADLPAIYSVSILPNNYNNYTPVSVVAFTQVTTLSAFASTCLFTRSLVEAEARSYSPSRHGVAGGC